MTPGIPYNRRTINAFSTLLGKQQFIYLVISDSIKQKFTVFNRCGRGTIFLHPVASSYLYYYFVQKGHASDTRTTSIQVVC